MFCYYGARERKLSAILKTYRGSCRKSMGYAKGSGRDSIDRSRETHIRFGRKRHTPVSSLQARDTKGLVLGVLRYIYEIFEVVKCHGARQSIADLRRLSNSPAFRQSARYRMARSQQEIQSRDLYPSSARLTDRRGTRNWGGPCADFGPQRSIGRCR